MKWTAEKIIDLCKDYNEIKDLSVIAEKYCIKVRSLKAILSYYGIKRGRKFCGEWNKEELEVLREEYPRVYDIEDLAKKLGRSLSAVQCKASNMGIKRCKCKSILFDEE